MLEIIIQGRGGQGAQTAGNLLARAFFKEGKQVQSFASYGGARRGTPVTSMIRVDEKPIRLRCDIERPDAILCFDRSLLDTGLLQGADRDTLIMVNSTGLPEDDSSLGDYRIFAIDAFRISQEHKLGRIVNSTLLGAFCCLLGAPTVDTMSETVFEAAPVKPDENVAACRAGFDVATQQLARSEPGREVEAT
ncbi:MAG: pyruvate ferredoxin oxidoreductase [Gammaproteobacteria bacterium]|nr:pyruvate ferredoxin oxidoreductase [Gammaproteobacteria bacterium]